MIKVMHLIHGLSTGGAETLVRDYCLNFDKNRFDVVLLCRGRHKESPYEKELREKGIRAIFVDDHYWFKHGSNLFTKTFRHFQQYIIIRQIIKKESPDILHTHLTENCFVKFARPKRGTIIFHTVHNEPRILWDKRRSRQKDYRAAKWLVKNYHMRFIVLHEEMKEEINRLFGVANSIVINNGIEIEKFRKKTDRSSIEKELGIDKNSYVIGHVGRLDKQKNHKFLIDVFNELHKVNHNAFLLMIGNGQEKERIIKQLQSYGLEDNYKILSNRNDIPELLKAMDVFVFPSLFEGLPVSLIEAQEAHLPCFVSDTVTNKAFISNLITTLSLKDSATKWAKKIIDYKKPVNIIINDAEWDIKEITKQLEHIYEDALMGGNNG